MSYVSRHFQPIEHAHHVRRIIHRNVLPFAGDEDYRVLVAPDGFIRLEQHPIHVHHTHQAALLRHLYRRMPLTVLRLRNLLSLYDLAVQTCARTELKALRATQKRSN